MLNRADYNFVVKYGEVTPDGVAVYDLNSRNFVYVNRFLRQMLGMGERQQLETGESMVKFVHKEDLEYAENKYRELLSIGCIAPAEFRTVSPEGTTRYLSAEVLWLEESYTFAIFAKDITAFRDHEEYVVKISAQKDTLLDMLLHNLSGPLYLSRDVLNLLEGSSGKEGEAGKLVTMMRETNSLCIGIIQQFLQEEHTESLKVLVRRSRFSVLEKTGIVVSLLREMNPQKQIALTSAISDNFVYSDSVKFCQIVHNILSNAVKFTGEKGRISVEISGVAHWVVVAVKDDGTGVRPDLREKLFLERVNGDLGLLGEPSNGMGLCLCAKLCSLIGATISYAPATPKGSVFTLKVPLE